ncbi:MAG: oxidoreductase [Chitinophagaceae bacterium]
MLLPLIQCTFSPKAQHVQILTSGTNTSIRGLSVVDDQVVWVSGSSGSVGKSLDGGKRWKWMVVKGFEKTDFRDIEAFDRNTAILMAIAEPAYILKTSDGGDTWKTVYENTTKGMFLDAMEFYDKKNGVVIGDPVNRKFFIAKTIDQGETWKEEHANNLPTADSGEACFASSGTNIRYLNQQVTCFVSGGIRSRYFSSAAAVDLPIIQGKPSTGANSIAVWNEGTTKGTEWLAVVGGNYAVDSLFENNCFISKDAGNHWIAPTVSPHGYRSCIEFINQKQLITCGTSGIDVSMNAGMNWKLISKESFHVCRKAKKGTSVFLAGSNGKVAKLIN